MADWSRSMINHLYWSVMSSNGNEEEVKEKWLSLVNHLHNKHKGHGKIYKRCSHRKLKRKWLKISKTKEQEH